MSTPPTLLKAHFTGHKEKNCKIRDINTMEDYKEIIEAYWLAPTLMTFTDTEGHSPARFFKQCFSYSCSVSDKILMDSLFVWSLGVSWASCIFQYEAHCDHR